MIIVLYTFDFIDQENFDMLKRSIDSVKEKIGYRSRIVVYTRTLEKLESLKDIELFLYNPKDWGHDPVDYNEPKMLSPFSAIGHSRIFLIPHLLPKYNLPVLYLDNDTYLSEDFNLDRLLSTDKICGYEFEPLTRFHVLFYKFYWEKIRKVDIGIVIKEFPEAVINNGCQFFPNNEESRLKSKIILEKFLHFRNIFDTHYNDMAAFSSVGPEPILSQLGLVHYYRKKKKLFISQ